jgi:hypothetical protein
VQLVNLLINMARNKLISAARREYRQRRDLRRSKAEALIALDQVPDGKQTAAEEIELRDLLNRIYERFTAEELWIARLRNSGATWENVAAELGGSAQSRRMQFSRALERVAGEIGLDLLS